MPKEKAKNEIKVTDKRIFTPEGEIREEFRQEINPADPAAKREEQRAEKPSAEPQRPSPPQATETANDRRNRTLAERGANPGTPFSNFIESLILQAYMSLGMLRNPYQPQTKPDPVAARQMIDILGVLQEKTTGNLTQEEADFLESHLGELKLAYVQRTKSL